MNQTTKNLNIGLKGYENAKKGILEPENGQFTKKYRDLTNNVRKAVKMAVEGKSGEEILKATNGKWTKNTENNQVMFNISDKDIEVIKPLQKNSKTTLGELIDHPELFFYYPGLKNMPIITENVKGGQAYYSDKNKDIHLDNNEIRDVAQIKFNLIHELQHAIQDIEGTLTIDGYGDSDASYLNNILEIEADDQVERYIKERKGQKVNKLTEVNKKRPTHSEYRKKNIVEKIPIAMYNIVNGYKGVVNQDKTNKRYLNNNSMSANNIFTVHKNLDTDNNRRYSQNTENTNKGSKNGNYLQKNRKSTEGLEESSSFNLPKNKTIEHKKEQLKIINETNPMFDDVHVGIRKVDDIKTWEEAMQDDESFVCGDFSREDAEKALKRGTITVYSSYPIKNGVFVSTSYAQAYEYAGHDHSKVHSRKVALDSVAWINGDEGQYAKVKPKVDENKAYQKTLDNAINVLKVQNKTSDTDIYFKAYQIASSEFKKLKTDEDYDIFNNRVVEIEKDLKEKFKELENSDIKYARQGNLEWQEYLEQHFNSEGTRTTKEEVKIAEKNQNKQKSKEELIQAFKEETDKIDVLSVDDQIKAIRELDSKELNNKLPDTSTMIVNKLKKEKTTFKDLTTQLRKYITNKGAAVDNLFKATGNEKGIWKYDRYLGSFTEGQTSIGVRQINSNGEVVGDSLLTIYDNAKKDGITQKILDDYVLNKDNIARSNYEKGIFGESITSNDSQKIVDEYDKKYPKLKDYANEVSNYANNNTKGYLVGNFISEDLYNKIREMYPDHVPVIRDISAAPKVKM